MHSKLQRKLYAEIEKTLVKIEGSKSDQQVNPPKLKEKTKNSLVFSFNKAKAPKAKVVEVAMGAMERADGNDILETSGLSHCNAVILCRNYSSTSNRYESRIMGHLLGGNISAHAIKGYGMNELADYLLNFAKNTMPSEKKPLLIFVGGMGERRALDDFKQSVYLDLVSDDHDSDLDYFKGEPRHPYLQMMDSCDVRLFHGSFWVKVHPDGTVDAISDYDAKAKKTIAGFETMDIKTALDRAW
jgi:hypothetical protein